MWAQSHKFMFKNPTERIEKFASMLALKRRKMVRRDAVTERADPYVIALAHYTVVDTPGEISVVVTEEKADRGQIPQISRLHKLRHLNLVGVMLEEEWSFR